MPAGGELGTKVGELWAYKLRLSGPLVPARILVPGRHYQASVEILVTDGPITGQRFWTTRARLPCLWDEREQWLEKHPDFCRDLPPEEELPADPFEVPADMLFGMGEAALRRIVREELQAVLNIPPKIAYTRQEAARAVGVSPAMISLAVYRSDLTPSYMNSKPVFTPEELKRWVSTFPDHFDR